MWYMFAGCTNLTSLDLSNFDTSQVTLMVAMFKDCSKFESLDLSNFDTSNVVEMSQMFKGCSGLKSIDLRNFDTSKVEYMYEMFAGCTGLTSLDLSHCDLSNVHYSNELLKGCSNLKSLYIHPSMKDLPSDTFRNFNTKDNPCTIYAPADFDFGVDTSGDCFEWKGGYFKRSVYDPSYIYVDDISIQSGKTADLTVCLYNGNKQYNGYQFNVHLPEGISIATDDDDEYIYTLSDRYSQRNPSIRITPQADGSYQVLQYSMDNLYLTGSEGPVITLKIVAENDVAPGVYDCKITDVAFNDFNDPEYKSVFLKDAPFTVSVYIVQNGDVNHDGAVNISDVMMTVNYVIGRMPVGFNPAYADFNHDNIVNISDIMYLVNIVIGRITVDAPINARE